MTFDERCGFQMTDLCATKTFDDFSCAYRHHDGGPRLSAIHWNTLNFAFQLDVQTSEQAGIPF